MYLVVQIKPILHRYGIVFFYHNPLPELGIPFNVQEEKRSVYASGGNPLPMIPIQTSPQSGMYFVEISSHINAIICPFMLAASLVKLVKDQPFNF
jgi:hypothetical protein